MSDEKKRLEAVSRFTEIDEGVAADLNEIVDLAARICDTPVALVTLVDRDVQWFKASKGVDMDSTDRNLAFCNHTIQQNGVLIVPNALDDLRFSQNPLVAEAPHVRFYAGATLTTNDGHNIGSLCVVDMEERELDQMQQDALKTLSKQVMRLMEISWAMRALEERNEETEQQKKLIEESEIKLRAIFNSTKDTHILLNCRLEIIAFNKAASEFFFQQRGVTLETGLVINDLLSSKTVERLNEYLIKAFKGDMVKAEWYLKTPEGIKSWRDVEFMPISAANGDIIGVAVNSADITERKLQEDQINIQNAALTRIAIIQSHELRRPVASLLGIMALLKLEQTKADNEYLEMLEFTVKELDQKIREIVKDSEDTIKSFLSVVA